MPKARRYRDLRAQGFPAGVVRSLESVAQLTGNFAPTDLDSVALGKLHSMLLTVALDEEIGQQAYNSTLNAIVRLTAVQTDKVGLKEWVAEHRAVTARLLEALEDADALACKQFAGKELALITQTAKLVTQAAHRGHPFLPNVGQDQRSSAVAGDPLEYSNGQKLNAALHAMATRRLQVLDTAYAALVAVVGRPPGSRLDPFLIELAAYWEHATGKTPSAGPNKGEISGPFVRYCRCALSCLPQTYVRQVAVDSAIKRVSEGYVRARTSPPEKQVRKR